MAVVSVKFLCKYTLTCETEDCWGSLGRSDDLLTGCVQGFRSPLHRPRLWQNIKQTLGNARDMLDQRVTKVLNYIIYATLFPIIWCQHDSFSIFGSGQDLLVDMSNPLRQNGVGGTQLNPIGVNETYKSDRRGDGASAPLGCKDHHPSPFAELRIPYYVFRQCQERQSHYGPYIFRSRWTLTGAEGHMEKPVHSLWKSSEQSSQCGASIGLTGFGACPVAQRACGLGLAIPTIIRVMKHCEVHVRLLPQWKWPQAFGTPKKQLQYQTTSIHIARTLRFKTAFLWKLLKDVNVRGVTCRSI